MFTCNVCKEPRPEEAFHKDKRSKWGHIHTCKTCFSSRRRVKRIAEGKGVYGVSTKEEIAEKIRQRDRERNKKRWSDPEYKAYQATYAKQNAAKLREGRKRYNQRHPDVRQATRNAHRARKLGGGPVDSEHVKHLRSLGRCSYCQCEYVPGTNAKFTIDHLIPVSRGGTNANTNLIGACLSCNSAKGDKTHIEYLTLLGVL